LRSYQYHDAAPTHANAYLWPVLKCIIQESKFARRTAFDLGCGNGATCNFLSELGFDVAGVDPSESGVSHAQRHFPHLRTEVAGAYENLSARFGKFDLVVSLEVIEHCFDPRTFAKTFVSLIAPGGIGVLSTPYHGYLKNVALALSGKMDSHFTALWDGGHIKFFSVKTLNELFKELDISNVEFLRVGRIPVFAKSMVAVVRPK